MKTVAPLGGNADSRTSAGLIARPHFPLGGCSPRTGTAAGLWVYAQCPCGLERIDDPVTEIGGPAASPRMSRVSPQLREQRGGWCFGRRLFAAQSRHTAGRHRTGRRSARIGLGLAAHLRSGKVSVGSQIGLLWRQVRNGWHLVEDIQLEIGAFVLSRCWRAVSNRCSSKPRV